MAWAVLILILSGDSASSGATEGWVRRIFGGLGDEAVFYINYSIRKGSHVVAYGILGALNLRALRYDRPVAAVLLAGVIAVIDETHQMGSDVRTGALADVGFDLCGAGLAVMLSRHWRDVGSPARERRSAP